MFIKFLKKNEIQMKTKENIFWNDPTTIAWFNNEPAPEYWKKFFEAADKTKIKKVLDLGCGAGRNAQLLYELGYDVYVCDLFDGMVTATTQRLIKAGMSLEEARGRVAKTSMLHLPYQSCTFDAIVSNGVYHNAFSVEELEQSVKESARVLGPEGFLCFNLFSSATIASDLVNLGENVYLTKEGLLMVLVTRDHFLSLAGKYGLVPTGETIEYEREVSTGKRSVIRGILQKKS